MVGETEIIVTQESATGVADNISLLGLLRKVYLSCRVYKKNVESSLAVMPVKCA